MTTAPTNIAEGSDDDASRGRSPAEEIIRQRKRGAELEDAIRAACVAELAELGYGSLTIESVAGRAQTGKASIYRRWPTKQALVLDSISCLMSGPLMRLIEREFDETVTTRDALLEVMVQVTKILTGPDGDAIRSVLGESLREGSLGGTFECEFMDPRKAALLNLLRRGVARGEVRPDAVDDVVVDLMAGGLVHRVLIRRLRPSLAELERMLDGFIMPAISCG